MKCDHVISNELQKMSNEYCVLITFNINITTTLFNQQSLKFFCLAFCTRSLFILKITANHTVHRLYYINIYALLQIGKTINLINLFIKYSNFRMFWLSKRNIQECGRWVSVRNNSVGDFISQIRSKFIINYNRTCPETIDFIVLLLHCELTDTYDFILLRNLFWWFGTEFLRKCQSFKWNKLMSSFTFFFKKNGIFLIFWKTYVDVTLQN